MRIDLRLQLGHPIHQQRQPRFVTLGQFPHAPRQPLTDPIHLAMNGRVQRTQLLVVHRKRLDLGL